MDIDGYRHNYEGFMKKTSFQMSINRGRTDARPGAKPVSHRDTKGELGEGIP